jgi:hypothetical protein
MKATMGQTRFELGLPEPPFRRMMAFIDGENVVYRFQALAKEGRTVRKETRHEPDVFAWFDGAVASRDHDIIRATYYTSATGDEGKLAQIRGMIKSGCVVQPMGSRMPNNLHSVVIKKDRREAKSKGVDIRMTTDILSHVYRNNVDTVLLMSGDGDYLPVVEEVIRHGKHVYVSAFRSGLNPRLLELADRFEPLEGGFFLD